jgi:hypothetical protein
MFLSRLPSELDRRVRSVETVEKSTILDVPCMHLAARAEDVDFQIWIPSNGEPLPRRIVITYKNQEGQPQFWANFTDWNLSSKPSDYLFTFTPPEGARRIPFLTQMEAPAEKASQSKKGGKK